MRSVLISIGVLLTATAAFDGKEYSSHVAKNLHSATHKLAVAKMRYTEAKHYLKSLRDELVPLINQAEKQLQPIREHDRQVTEPVAKRDEQDEYYEESHKADAPKLIIEQKNNEIVVHSRQPSTQSYETVQLTSKGSKNDEEEEIELQHKLQMLEKYAEEEISQAVVKLDDSILEGSQRDLEMLRTQVAIDEENKIESIRNWYQKVSKRIKAELQTEKQKQQIRKKFNNKLKAARAKMEKMKREMDDKYAKKVLAYRARKIQKEEMRSAVTWRNKRTDKINEKYLEFRKQIRNTFQLIAKRNGERDVMKRQDLQKAKKHAQGLIEEVKGDALRQDNILAEQMRRKKLATIP